MGHLCHWSFASKRYREKVSSPSESVCTPICTPETSPCELRGRGLDTNADGLCDKVATTAARTRTATDDADMPTDDFIILFDLKYVTTTYYESTFFLFILDEVRGDDFCASCFTTRS